MKSVEIILRRGEGKKKNDGECEFKIYLSTYVNITMCLPEQLLYSNKTFKNKIKYSMLNLPTHYMLSLFAGWILLKYLNKYIFLKS
jgi:hypothetical protein